MALFSTLRARVATTLALCSLSVACAHHEPVTQVSEPAVQGASSPARAVRRSSVPLRSEARSLDLPKTASHQRIGPPYVIAGKRYVPARQNNYRKVGLASWYGEPFHGRKTANGEVYDMNAISAAHKTLPLPSVVKVTNLENGHTLHVRVNDRGPFVDDRIIDLSRAAADELGFRHDGIAKVRVEYVGADFAVTPRRAVKTSNNTRPSARSGKLYIQAAAYLDIDRAREARRDIGRSARIERARVDGRAFKRVLVGPWSDPNEAEQARLQLAARGYPDSMIVRRR